MIVLTNKWKEPFEIDDEDYTSVSNFLWSINRGYPATNVRYWVKYSETWCPRWVAMELHEFLLGKAPIGFEWDHQDRNRLNNHRSNLRILTVAENRKNKSLYKRSTSGVVGISSISAGWNVELTQTMTRTGKRKWVGEYPTLEAAVIAQQRALELQ